MAILPLLKRVTFTTWGMIFAFSLVIAQRKGFEFIHITLITFAGLLYIVYLFTDKTDVFTLNILFYIFSIAMLFVSVISG